MEYNLENAIKAKNCLIEKGFNESDFYEAQGVDIEVGYILNEPMIITNNEDMKSAFELFNDTAPTNKEVDNYLDFLFPNGL